MINWVPDKNIKQEIVDNYLSKSKINNQFTNYGPTVQTLEEKIKKLLKVDDTKTVIVTNSGTGALHALGYGIELFNKKTYNWATQSFTFPPSAQGPYQNAVIIDIDNEGGLSLENIPNSVDAIIVTNIFGNVTNLEKYEEFCKTTNRILIFDNAATPYTFFKNKNCINYGVGSIISFHHTKPIGFGEGGAIIVDKKYEKSIRQIMNFGINLNSNTYFLRSASNYKLSDISAAYILQYLHDFDNIINIHLNLYKYLKKKLENYKFIKLYPNFSSSEPFLSCFCLLFDNYDDSVRLKLIENNVFCRKYYYPLKRTPKTLEFFDKILCVPCNKDMTEKDIDKIVNLICIK